MTRLAGKKVLHVLGGSAYGGGSKVILNLARAALAEGAQVDILTTNDQMAREARAAGVGVVHVDVIRRSIHPVRDLRGLLGLISLLRRHKYDMVHTHTSKAGIIGRVAARVAGVPFILHTMHGLAFHERSPKWQVLAVGVAERFGAAFCDLVVSVSHSHGDLALRLRLVPEGKLVVIPNGIREALPVQPSAVNSVRKELSEGGMRTILLCHGRLATQKGIEYLLDALALLQSEGALPRDVRLAVAGEGPLGQDLKVRAEQLGLCDSVWFLGFRTDIDALLDASDVVVLPSLREGLSIALMEAMARGCLVAVSDIPNNAELIKHGRNGLVYATADVRALARALKPLIDDPAAFGSLARQAKADVESTHSLRAMQEAYVDVYASGLAFHGR
ncbi:glycosyltransferase family 4 protein [Terrabacter sp. 2RAF25]|uniref:glycosyltransferase family 4 protein n=1 Tax=Terrabacter sp. 2RAF25 TaxID=3232998 RepID=UPI003F9CF619